MRFASSVSTNADVQSALTELIEPIDGRVTPGMVDLVTLFVTAHFEDDLPEIVERVSAAFPHAVLLGCTACGTIGVNREIEDGPSMSLLAASMPDVNVRPFHLDQSDLDGAATDHDWERIVAVAPSSNPLFVALGDPFRIDVNGFIDRLNNVFPGAPLVGGVASAGHQPGENRLICAGEIHREGIVGVALTGRFVVDTVVSQGCRPIGRTFVITKGERNIVQEIGGRPPLEQLHDVLINLSDQDEALARKSLFVGRVIDESKETFERGDFLIHNIIGVDRKSGEIAIAGQARVGATVRFHVRDADSADEDLRKLLSQHASQDVRGAMIFGCNGRGTQMWDKPGHDIGVLREIAGNVPAAGFFCGGEFGPVGGRNFVHGFTASIALFRPQT